jgi:mannose-1-phosphate guanylyltransferase/mannose-6-phosphate isomerase
MNPASSSVLPVLPVILCGGSGTRLWPLSRAGFPKQFLCLTGEQSLFQQAALRLAGLGGEGLSVAAPLLVTHEDHRFLTLEQLRELDLAPARVLLEPVARNTAPALSLAAMAALEQGDDPILVVTPSDQTIQDLGAFTRAARAAVRAAASGSIVVLGIKPLRPETGYGYVRAGAPVAGLDAVRVVDRFVEKPGAATAQAYVADGGYFWNAGMFVLRASTWLQALRRFRPDIAQAVEKAWQTRAVDGPFARPDKAAFEAIAGESIDYAVMEHCPGSDIPIAMVALDAGWSDLGAWDAVWDALPRDENGNAHRGDVMAVDTHNTLVHASHRLVSVVGLRDVVVIETADAVLVADRARAQDVKQVVAQLAQSQRVEHALHRKVHRPWGWYDSVDEGDRFKVKRIQVRPGASLSLQMHHHRAEHWIVVRGTAEITCGKKRILLTENQSTYIPLGEKHRLANPGTIPLEIIEVQSGSYLGEDDIVRFEDTYGRR